MSERVTARFDENGKPYDVQAGPTFIGFGSRQEKCLAEMADPDANIASADCPHRCGACGTPGYIEDGIYYYVPEEATAVNACTRYVRRPSAIELATTACAGADWSDLRVVPVERPSTSGNATV